MAAGNLNNLDVVEVTGPGDFRFWRRDARGAWTDGGTGEGDAATIAAWREDLLVFFDTGRYAQFGLKENRVWPVAGPRVDARGRLRGRPGRRGLRLERLGQAHPGPLGRRQVDVGARRGRPGARPGPRRPPRALRGPAVPGVARGGRAAPGEDGPDGVARAVHLQGRGPVAAGDVAVVIASAPLVASDGERLIFLYQKPGEGAAWTLASYLVSDEDWHETGAVSGKVPAGPVALARQGRQFFVVVLADGKPQVAPLDPATGRLGPFAPPAVEKAAAPTRSPRATWRDAGDGAGGDSPGGAGVAAGALRRSVAAAPGPAGVAAAPLVRRAVACAIDHIFIGILWLGGLAVFSADFKSRLAAQPKPTPTPEDMTALLLLIWRCSLLHRVRDGLQPHAGQTYHGIEGCP